MSTEERIKQEAENQPASKRLKKAGINVTDSFLWEDGFVKGALSERNKVIEEVKALFAPMYNVTPTADNLINILELMKESHLKLESLKV